MNKTITIYELLGLVKDGKAPKKIKYEEDYLLFDDVDKDYFSEKTDALFTKLFSKTATNYLLNDKVEIIEDNDKLKHGENYVDFADLIPDSKFDYLYEMESRIIDHINKIEETLNVSKDN